jgi:hypothetical protein
VSLGFVHTIEVIDDSLLIVNGGRSPGGAGNVYSVVGDDVAVDIGEATKRLRRIYTQQLHFGAPVTLASLGTAASAGEGVIAYVSDLTAPTYRGVAAGGGAVKGLVFSDGANWMT